ncbi:MAG TPA: TolC family protein [Terracidiphilus sp.]|jgi:cobalt-zinc-cadmium efflux system outer membrane protein
MKRISPTLFGLAAGLCLALLPSQLMAQQPLTWDQVKTRFETGNPTLRADALGVDEAKAQETTAYLRPNPQFTLSEDGTQIVPDHGVWQPLVGTYVVPTLSYLHERDHKRELRLQSAQQGTRVATSQHEDLKRNLEFTLRTAFNNTLQAKAIVALAKSDLEYYDHIIQISRDRFKAGDIAQIDLDRIELLRVQYETEIQSAQVSLRTAKIQLLQLINDRTPVEKFDVDGPFDFSDALKPLEDFRQVALDARPDLQAALQTIQQSETNHKLAIANGSTDPTFSGWYTYNSSNNNPNGTQTIGASVNIPLRIFDHNQGEKQRTLIDIDKSKQASEATRAQVFGDVDSAYAQVESNITLLKPYKDKYKDQATRVRDTVTYAYQHGGASLIDMLNAQSDYRTVQLAYLQLIGSYLNAAGQLNLAVGREVIP